MFGKKKQKQNESVTGRYVITLKGVGALAAIRSGLCEKMPDGSGYKMERFMTFWDSFEKELDDAMKHNDAIPFK